MEHRNVAFDPQVYWENRLSASFNSRGVGFGGLGKQYNKWLSRVKRFVFLGRLKATDLDFLNLSVLDVGSGTGFIVECWHRLRVAEVTGIDLTAVAVENLRSRYPHDHFHQIDIGADLHGLPETGFDAISAFDVLYHIVDDDRFERAIYNISTLLKPGGLLILSGVFPDKRIASSEHVVFRAFDTFATILLAHKLEIVAKCPLFYLMNKPLNATGPLYQLLWNGIFRIARTSELGGLLIGGLLYPMELALVSIMSSSPTTEIMICHKSH